MEFHIGDKVIHASHGLGEVIQIEQKMIQDTATKCYVVRTANLTIWIPINGDQPSSLRAPARPEDFDTLFAILSSPNSEMLEDRLQRKDHLMTLLRDGRLESICQVIRDLSHYKRNNKLNDQEKTILDRAMNSLLGEWVHSLGVSHSQAQQAMMDLLGA